MCSLTVGLMAAQTGLQMYQNNMQAKAQKAQYEMQAEQARMNQQMLATKASLKADEYALKQKSLNDKFRLAIGNARAQAGGSGLSAENGSVVDIMDSSANAYNQDTTNLLTAQRTDSWTNYVEQVNEINKMNAYNQMAHNVSKQNKLNQFGTFLNGAASIYGQGYKEGLWGSSSKKVSSSFIGADKKGVYGIGG